MSVSFETLEKLKTQLNQCKDLGAPIQSDLYSHLTEVFNRIMLHHPNDGYDKFEDISGLVKQTNFKIRDPSNDYDINEKAGVVTNQDALDMIAKAKNLLNENPDLVSPADRALLSMDYKCVIANYQDHAEMLEWAGIGFGADMNYMIQKSLKRLAKMSGASSLRLFGKIQCTKQDYWVAQGELLEAEEDPTNPSQELRGKGANESVFWVTHNIMNDWIQLPDVQPHMISAARMIKKMLTGNLSASIDSCPPFPGKERDLLRAQLARIQHATQLSPKDLFEIAEPEEDDKVHTGPYRKYKDEAPDQGVEALKDLGNWSHDLPILLKAGRCTHIPPVGHEMNEEDLQAFMDKQAEEDKVEDRFKPIAEDTPVPNFDGAWLSKVCGDNQTYTVGEGTKSYAVNVIKSMRWPGAVTVAKGGQYCNIYVGDAIKQGDAFFNPTKPPDVCSDPSEKVDQIEPQGKDPAPAKNSDNQSQKSN